MRGSSGKLAGCPVRGVAAAADDMHDADCAMAHTGRSAAAALRCAVASARIRAGAVARPGSPSVSAPHSAAPALPATRPRPGPLPGTLGPLSSEERSLSRRPANPPLCLGPLQCGAASRLAAGRSLAAGNSLAAPSLRRRRGRPRALPSRRSSRKSSWRGRSTIASRRCSAGVRCRPPRKPAAVATAGRKRWPPPRARAARRLPLTRRLLPSLPAAAFGASSCPGCSSPRSQAAGGSSRRSRRAGLPPACSTRRRRACSSSGRRQAARRLPGPSRCARRASTHCSLAALASASARRRASLLSTHRR